MIPSFPCTGAFFQSAGRWRALREPRKRDNAHHEHVRNDAAAACWGSAPTRCGGGSAFGYPKPRRTQGGHRQLSWFRSRRLRQALPRRQHLVGDRAQRASAARARPPRRRCSRLLGRVTGQGRRHAGGELAVRRSSARSRRSCCPWWRRSRSGPAGAEMQFAWRFATGWLAAARCGAAAHRPDGGAVLMFDASQLLRRGTHARPGRSSWSSAAAGLRTIS